MTEVECWFADTFRREGPNLIIGPIPDAHRLSREGVSFRDPRTGRRYEIVVREIERDDEREDD